MKYLQVTLTIFLSLIYYSNFAQKLVVKKTFYDIYQTKLKSEWQQSGNGYINGYYKEYHSNGKLYIDRFVITDDVYPYWSTDLKYIEYDEAGNIMWSVRRNAKKQFEGYQVSYIYSGTSLKLKSKASFNQGKLISYNLNWNSGLPYIEYIVGKSFKRYSSFGKLLDNVTISSDGTPSGKFYQGNNDDLIIEVQNGKIQTVKPLNNDLDKFGHLFRLSNDTLASSFVSDNFRHKKYYIDTVTIKFLNNPFVDADFTQWQRGFIGLLFLDPRFLSCGSSKKYCFDMLFYNRDLLTYVKEEKRDLKSDQLLSMFSSEKDIHYYPSGKIKEIAFSNTNWEQFDENGTVINSYEKELKSIYEKKYNYLLVNKTAMLKVRFGLNKYYIKLEDYRKNPAYFIQNTSPSYPGFSQLGIEGFKVLGSNILLMENQIPSSTHTNISIREATVTKDLLEQRKKLFDIILENGIDNQPFLFCTIEQEGGGLYEIKIKEGFKNIFMAYRLLTNELNDSITKITSIEPTNILSKKYKTTENLDLEKDKEVISLLASDKFTDYTIDNDYIPEDWIAFNNNYFYLAEAHNKLIDTFLDSIKLNRNKLDKKLKGATNSSEIKLILNNLK